MARVLRFTTSAFDVSKETPNPINPIAGQSLLLWLMEEAKSSVPISVPEAEDWGWCSCADWNGRRFLLGASASDELPDGQREWVLQVEQLRSWKERLLGRSTGDPEDECARYFQGLLAREPRFSDLSADR